MYILDVECYHNWFLLSFLEMDVGQVYNFEVKDGVTFDKEAVKHIMAMNTTVSFNGISYDLPMISAALAGFDNTGLKKLNDNIITSKSSFQVVRDNNLTIPEWDHIDLMNVAPGTASLKLYGARLMALKLQDLPINPDTILTEHQIKALTEYCRNDLETTLLLYRALEKQVNLRKDMSAQYGLDLRSKGDAQIAEAVLSHELEAVGVSTKRPVIKPGTTFKYDAPVWLNFKSDTLKSVYETAVSVDFKVQPSGAVAIPAKLGQVIKYNLAGYKMGIGGLHSTEKSQTIICGDDEVLFDADFTSYYPSIILAEKYYPAHLSDKFLEVYQQIVEKRLKAKAEKDMVTANSLKITINGSFGKFGNKYSKLYAPKLLIQVTVTGQLGLLMLIEMVTMAGGKVVSANTDGIVILVKKDKLQQVQEAMFEFELVSGYNLEETPYKMICSESVNSYIAIELDGKAKMKGAYGLSNLGKNSNTEICSIAVVKYLKGESSIEDTVNSCEDIRKFISIRKVAGGAVWQGEELGKVVRWYYGNTVLSQPIMYKSGNKVPKTDRGIPLMDLCEGLPDDLNKDWYIHEAKAMLKKLGYKDA